MKTSSRQKKPYKVFAQNQRKIIIGLQDEKIAILSNGAMD